MLKGFSLPVLDKGYVKYLDHFGSDDMIVRVARMSTTGDNKTPQEDAKLLKYLFLNRHTSPFEQATIQFEIKMPIFVMRQFVRHRTFRLNEFSARYSEVPDEYYLPEKFRTQGKKNKQGSAEEFEDPLLLGSVIEAYKLAHNTYLSMLSKGVSRELARVVLPVALYTKITVVCDLHNLMHFLWLRLHPHAQLEIQAYAEAMFDIMRSLFPGVGLLFKNYSPQIVDRMWWSLHGSREMKEFSDQI